VQLPRNHRQFSAAAFAVVALVTPAVAGNTSPDGLALLREADRLADFYNWADAAPLYERAERALSLTGDFRDALAAKLGRMRASMETYSLPALSDEFAALLKSSQVQGDAELKLRCLMAKGDVDGEINARLAESEWNEVQAIARARNDRRLDSRCNGELAILGFIQGQVQVARRLMASAITQAHIQHDVGAEVRFLSASGSALALVHSFGESLPYFERADAIATANPEIGVPFPLYWGKVKALIGLGRMSEAQRLADLAIDKAREKNKRVKLAQFMIASAGIASRSGATDKAIAQLREAVDISAAGGFRRLGETADFDLSDIFRARGELQAAEQYAKAGIGEARASGETFIVPACLTSLASIEAALNKTTEAEALYKEALDDVEAMLFTVPDQRTEVALLTAMSRIYTNYFVMAAQQLKNSEKAFDVVEQIRGRALTDFLRGSGPREWDPQASPAREQEINRLRMHLVQATTPRQRRDAMQALFLAGQSEMASDSVQIRRLAGRPANISSASVRSRLRPDEVLIEYVLAKPASYCIVLTREHTRLVQLASSADIEALVDSEIKNVRRPEKTSAKPAQDLYAALLEPISEVRTKSRLVIVPDGLLHLVPFSALIDEAHQFLVMSHVISYAPSARSLYLLDTRRVVSPPTRSLLAIGGVDYSQSDRTLVAAIKPGAPITRSAGLFSDNQTPLPQLPGSVDEINGISAIVGGGTAIIGTAATKANLKAQPLQAFDILHFAVHAVADPGHPEQAALILRNDPKNNQDGYLEPAEVARLKLRADLVTLSACETAVGRLQGQEGVANLARAFFHAGSRTVVSTLWRIDDNYSLFLMKRFYTHLKDHASKADALTMAQRDLITHFGPTATPYYWAPFILIGEANSPIVLPVSK
jgi:CHAT domain-containing protein